MRLGRLPQNSFDRLFEKALPPINNGNRNVKPNGISVLPDGRCSVTVSMVINGMADAELAFHRAYAALRAGGGIPDTLLLCINARRRDSEKQIKLTLQKYDELCTKRNITLFPTCIQVLGDQRTYTLTIMGKVKESSYRPKSGAYICMAGYGAAGTKMLAEGCREKLLERFSEVWLDEINTVVDLDDILDAVSDGEYGLQPVSEGGILAALWDLKEQYKMGFTIDRLKISFRQETIEICDFLGLNPYQLSGDGSLLIVCDSPDELREKMDTRGIPFEVLGAFTEKKACTLITKEESTCLDRPEMDGIWQFTNKDKEEITHERSDS